MAKGKHSVALFEVISSSKTSRRDSLLRTPSWWFKRRGSGSSAAGGASVPSSQPNLPIPPNGSHTDAPAQRIAGVDLKLDADRQRITFQLSYASAIVAAFAVVVVLGLALVIGQRMSSGPAPAMAGPSTEQIRKLPANPEVLNITPSAPASARRGSAPAGASAPAPASAQPTNAAAASPPAAPPALQTAPTTGPSGKRVLGLQYILVQSYPPAEKQMAIDACDLLNKNNIPCTVETEVQGWASAYCVVGQRGFPRASGAEYDAYEKAIRDLSDKYGKNSKFKRFNPMPIAGKFLKISD